MGFSIIANNGVSNARSQPCRDRRLGRGARAEELHESGQAFGPVYAARERRGAQSRGASRRASCRAHHALGCADRRGRTPARAAAAGAGRVPGGAGNRPTNIETIRPERCASARRLPQRIWSWRWSSRASSPFIPRSTSTSQSTPRQSTSLRNDFDAGIRTGEHLAHDMIAVRISREMHFVAVASPAYLARRGEPKSPQDLAAHECIRVRLPSGAFVPWRLRMKRRNVEVHAERRLAVNDGRFAVGRRSKAWGCFRRRSTT